MIMEIRGEDDDEVDNDLDEAAEKLSVDSINGENSWGKRDPLNSFFFFI